MSTIPHVIGCGCKSVYNICAHKLNSNNIPETLYTIWGDNINWKDLFVFMENVICYKCILYENV